MVGKFEGSLRRLARKIVFYCVNFIFMANLPTLENFCARWTINKI
jgi:hypothetical protein